MGSISKTANADPRYVDVGRMAALIHTTIE